MTKNYILEVARALLSRCDGAFKNKEAEKLKTKYPFLYPFQAKAVARALNAPGFGFFWEMGTGKTIAALTLIKEFGAPAIVIVPVSIIPEWIRMNNDFNYNLDYQVIRADKNKRKEMWSNLKQLNLVSYETFREDYYNNRLNFTQKFIMILDEASKIKNNKAKVTRAVKKVSESDMCIYTCALTGTPLENHLLDYYSIINAIKPGYITWKEFANNYCVWGQEFISGRGYINVIQGYKNLDAFARRIKPISDRVRKEDVLPDLPEKIWQYRFIELSPKQEKLKNIVIDTAQDIGVSFLGVFQILRLLADGIEYLKHSNSEILANIPDKYIDTNYTNPKKLELLQLLDELNGEQVVIFTQFEKVASDLYNQLKKEGLNVAVITGATPHSKRGEIVKAMNEGEYQILLCDDVLAYGVNLPQVDYLINYDIHPNPAKMRQRADRIHRLDSKNAKTIISFVAGVERDIYDILKEKSILFEQVVEGVEVEKVDITRVLAEKYGFER